MNGWFFFTFWAIILPLIVIAIYCYDEKNKRFEFRTLIQVLGIFGIIGLLGVPFALLQRKFVADGRIVLKLKLMLWGLEITDTPWTESMDWLFDWMLVATESLIFLLFMLLIIDLFREEKEKQEKTKRWIFDIFIITFVLLRFFSVLISYDFNESIYSIKYVYWLNKILFSFAKNIPYIFVLFPIYYLIVHQYREGVLNHIFHIESSFLGVLLSNNLIKIILGFALFLVSALFCPLEINSKDLVNVLVYYDISIGSLLLILVPLFYSIRNFESLFESDFNSKLRNIIQRSENPMLIIGYGNLGERVAKEFLKRRDNIKLITKKILTPDLDVKEITENLIVVSKDQRSFDRVHTDPIFQDIGVVNIEEKDINNKFLIPAIVGDINNGSTQDSCKLLECRGFVSLVNDEKAILTLFDLAYEKNLKAIISMENSPEKEFLICRSPSKDIFLIYPEQEEGIAVGMLLYETLIKWFVENNEKKPKILICGRGKQMYYIIETLELMSERFGPYTDGIARRWHMQDNLIILSDEQDFDNRADILPPNAQTKAYPRLLEEILFKSLKRDEWRYNCLINDSPDREKTMWKLLNNPRTRPEIIVVSSRVSEEITKIVDEWIDVIEKYRNISGNERYRPRIVVGTVSKEEKIIKEGAMIFYGTNISTNETEFPAKFPSQKFDSFINIYKDTKELVSGLAEALSKNEGEKHPMGLGKYIEPTGLYICVPDVKGSLAEIFSRLSKINYAYISYENKKTPEEILSPHYYYTRYENCSKKPEKFSFESDAILSKEKMSKKDPIEAALILNKGKSGIDTIRNLIVNDENDKIEIIRKILGINNGSNKIKIKKEDLDRITRLLDVDRGKIIDEDCLYKVTCPVGAYRRKVKDLLDDINIKLYKNLGLEEKIKNELRRFYLYTNTNKGSNNSEINFNVTSDPYAKINVCCKYGDTPGSLGFLLNTMLFKRKKASEEFEENQSVVDVTYMRTYECYKNKKREGNDYTLQEIYGNILEENQDQFKKRYRRLTEELIDFILIRPITKKEDTKTKEDWIDYAKDLRDFLDEGSSSCSFELFHTENYHNLAIVNTNFLEGECESNKPLPIKCGSKDCAIYQRAKWFNWKRGV